MDNEYGSDFMTIMDEDGTEFELEILSSIEYNGFTYLAVTPAGAEEDAEMEVSILKSVEEMASRSSAPLKMIRSLRLYTL